MVSFPLYGILFQQMVNLFASGYMSFMAKAKTIYVCQACGTQHPKWQGQCSGCGVWDTLVEEITTPVSSAVKAASSHTLTFVSLQHQEWDRVCGGGLVPGSALLVGGDPGIGKSTLLLQLAANLAAKHTTLYISGEESTNQIRLRAERLGIADANVALASSSHLEPVLTALKEAQPTLVIIDSIQTLSSTLLDSAPGTVAQVRLCAHELVKAAKKYGFSLVLVGHVTKDGTIAGPKVLEHMVDTVLYFEGDRGHQFRILRTVKNRFGATDEIGVFMMGDKGLEEVANPSALFLSQRRGEVSGAAVLAGMEGTRPLLVEIQALVTPSPFGTPRRTTVGWDVNRLAMVLAVLEARAGLPFSGKDVYLNVAGGLRIQEPAADFAAAAALASALTGTPLPGDTVFFGELGLSGEIRPVAQAAQRLKEAAKLGFKSAIIPETSGVAGLKEVAMPHIRQLSGLLA
jgi:DNA repair protein RadA/Sms